MWLRLSILIFASALLGAEGAHQHATAQHAERPRVRELDLSIGHLPTGPQNAITDVEGVLVGHATVIEGDSIRTGVTVVRPHPGDVFASKVPGAIHVANGFGKLAGSTQVEELGTIETPIALTNTLAVGRVADALARWTLEQTSDRGARSVNPIVAETNDGFLNAIRVARVGDTEVRNAIDAAVSGPVMEGSVGAGTGTRSLGFKGGIGTASRRVRIGSRTFTLGALVQSNFGGALEIGGVRIGHALGGADFIERWIPIEGGTGVAVEEPQSMYRLDDEPDAAGGSLIIVLATDAPVDASGLTRIARRAPYAIGRVGGFSSHGSGDYVVAFSTAPGLRSPAEPEQALTNRTVLRDEALSPLFMAAIEATEEAILNSLFRATTVVGHRGSAEAIPLDRVREMLEAAGRVPAREATAP